MTKQTKTLLGLAVVAGVGYYAYTQFSKPKSSFANLMAPNCQKNPKQCPCDGGAGGDGCPNKKDSGTDQNGRFYEICQNGHLCYPKGGGRAQLEFVG
jgi:hypothetical protein